MKIFNEKITPENITALKENEVFVFGSNVQGEHVGGAALTAVKVFGAEMGKGEGMQGNSYAIPTCERVNGIVGGKELRYTKPFDNVRSMIEYVRRFFFYAGMHPELTFYVTKIGCGIAGFKANEVAPLFAHLANMKNVYLPKEFIEVLKEI